MLSRRRCSSSIVASFLVSGLVAAAEAPKADLALPKIPGSKPRNIVLILTDDHRWDAMSCAGHPFLKTPRLDSLATGGAHLRNAFVTTSLCSPSRASILTGLYAHRHGVIDNNNSVPPGLTYFPQYLQHAGYATAMFGKWHMGSDDDVPQPGFDRWVSFKGQGTYWPNQNGLNVDGKNVAQRGYLTDDLTDYAVEWLTAQTGEQPFFLYLAHKAVHVDLLGDGKPVGRLLVPGIEGEMGFIPAPRHAGRYANEPFPQPESMAFTPRNYADKPMWVQNRRNSRHGVELPFGNKVGMEVIYRQYMETLLAVDESVGRVLDTLKQKGMLESTLVVYLGDNGYSWGEHGMVDKRSAYEDSMRTPMLAHCPELIAAGTKVDRITANIDIAPTLLEAAGLAAPPGIDGRSFLPLVSGKQVPWRDRLLYEYFWEWNFPQTPTLYALRTDRYKFIRAYGLWDIDELYDLENDPKEIVNLAYDPQHKQRAAEMKTQMFQLLRETDGLKIPMPEDRGGQSNQRLRGGTPQGPFPERIYQN